ncbi:MAG: response regulator transcription factor [Acidobacteriota bacterium]|jgi:two-component system phosphate regulon response regulator PhoB
MQATAMARDTRSTVLVVDDEPDIVKILGHHLEREGFRVLAAGDGSEACAQARQNLPDLVILDLMLPEMSGMEVLKALRHDENTRQIPIILLTAKRDDLDRVLGFELGADDYVTKPFNPREMVLRARAILKRREQPEKPTGEVIVKGPIRVDLGNHVVRVAGETVSLTLTEFRLLTDLLRAGGRVRTRESLLDKVWGYDAEVMSRTIDTHIRRLRRKLGPAAEWLVTVRGVGYRIQDPASGE